MRTISYKKTLANATLTEEDAMDLKVQQQYGSAFVMYTDSTNVIVTLYYVFTDPDGTEVDTMALTTQSLTQNVGTVVSFPWKAGHVRATVKATSTMSGGTLRIDASTSN